MKRLLSCLVIVALLAVAPAARGDGDAIVHKVKKGDTLELLAAEYYGDRNHELFIMVANGMDHPRPLVPGENIKIPASREVTADVGDTFESLATSYLGDKRRAAYLAQFNGLDESESLAVGTVVTIPFTLTHTAAGPESIADITAAYFGDTKNAELVKQYNFLDRDTLSAGDTIDIPIPQVRVRASKQQPPDKESQERSAKRKRIQAEAAEIIPAARASWRQGDYAAIKRDLTKVDSDFLDAIDAADIGVLLGCAYVATGDPDSALAAFQHVLERRPTHTLDAYTYSPKIRAVWQKAGGKVTDE